MIPQEDGALLRRFAEEADEAAFRTLVIRHLPLVHAVAARQLGGDTQLAEDAAQVVFTLLARNARRLSGHPSLAGWLFTTARNTAANMRRARVRRIGHEQQSAQLAETDSTAPTTRLWCEVRPLLDEGLARLAPVEREVLLLRIAQGAGYSEIATRCGLRENTARMRAERALEKLRGWLAKRGITSTVAALGAAAAAHAAPALTPSVATHVASEAMVSAATLGSTSGVLGTMNFMAKIKIGAAIAVIAVSLVIYEATEWRAQSRELARWQEQAMLAEATLARQTHALREANSRVQAADEDNARLIALISGTGIQERRDPSRGSEAQVSRQEATRRFEHANALAARGHFDDALTEYLWCFEVGMRGFSFFDYRHSKIPAALTTLVEQYPAAAELLRERRAEFLRRAEADATDIDAVFDFAGMSKALRDPAAIVDAMNRFPLGDPRRETMLNQGAYDTLFEARNYGALAREKPPEKMLSSLNLMLSVPINGDAKAQADYCTQVLKNAARDFEVLVGVGDKASARQVAERILAKENSAATRALLVENAKRAGRSDWKLPGS